MLRLASVVGGVEAVGGAEALDLSPARPDEVVARVGLADATVAQAAVDAAGEAWNSWRDTPAPERGAILHRAATLVEERAEPIGHDLTREEGKTLAEAVGETRRAAAILRYFAGQTLEPDGETYPSHSAATFLYARRGPLGVVTAITPWNFPIAIPAWKIAPALAYGNTVCWKPAEIVPLTAWHFFEALREAGLPPGVLNLVLGRGSEVGDVLVESAAVDAVTFTGSNEVGRAVQLKAIAKGKKVQLELGGKNPAVVLADADLALAAEHVARGAFLSRRPEVHGHEPRDRRRDGARRVHRRAWSSTPRAGASATRSPPTPASARSPRPPAATVRSYLDVARADGGGCWPAACARSLGDGYYVRPP